MVSHLIGPVILATSCRPRNSQDYIRRTVSSDPVGSSPLGSLPCGAARDPQTVANIEALGERVVHNSKFFVFFFYVWHGCDRPNPRVTARYSVGSHDDYGHHTKS